MSQTLKLYIPKVLSENKVVLLKGIGTLRINYREAVVNQELSLILPPREEIYFIPSNESRIDPVLVKIVELVTQVDPDEASDLVFSFMEGLQVELRTNGILSFPSVGWIKQDKWGSLFFEPAAEYIAINRFFGFSEMRLPEALTKAEQDVLADLKETAHEGATERVFRSDRQPQRRWGFIISAALVLITALAFMLSQVVGGSGGDTELIAEKTIQTEKKVTESETPVVIEDTNVALAEEPAPMPVFRNIGPKFLPTGKVKDPTITFFDSDQNSCVIIVGAFANEGNISKMIDRIEQSSYRSVVIPGERLTKVGLKIDCNIDRQSTLTWAKKEFDESAWVYTQSL